MENNNITLTAQVISPQSEEYSCLDFFFKYTRIKILRRERKTLAIVQIITALIMFAVGIVMHDSALLISSIGLLYWMPLIFLVSASLLIVLVDRPNKNLARACGGLYIVTALISFVSVILLATGRDNNWSYCSPPESSMCRLV
ncbi:membrane-spanning 4-domains subfamily A member 4A-like [Hoplias malabaricus]|uniref:membrane-spanning 4-domains subfamily A member 4A-like n=1 Tax=Hoplias malabaricus TaxID=27720 RepID=UPI0034633ACD